MRRAISGRKCAVVFLPPAPPHRMVGIVLCQLDRFEVLARSGSRHELTTGKNGLKSAK